MKNGLLGRWHSQEDLSSTIRGVDQMIVILFSAHDALLERGLKPEIKAEFTEPFSTSAPYTHKRYI
jgi:hypothetical protein